MFAIMIGYRLAEMIHDGDEDEKRLAMRVILGFFIVLASLILAWIVAYKMGV